MRAWWRSLFSRPVPTVPTVDDVNRLRAGYARLSDEEVKVAGRLARTLPEVVALTAVVAARVLGVTMFDVQMLAALALARGKIVEMQTGEGKTLAAVPAVAWHARTGRRACMCMTVNDYLARRDADWMGGIYELLGLSVGYVQQGMSTEERRERLSP